MAAGSHSVMSFTEGAGLQSSCQSPRDVVIGGQPDSVVPYASSSPLDRHNLNAEKVPVVEEDSKPPTSPSFGTIKETADIEIKPEPRSPVGFKCSALHEDISDEEVETVKAETGTEMKVDIKDEISAEEADRKKTATEVKEEATVKVEEAKQEDCCVKVEPAKGVDGSSAVNCNSEMDGEKPEVGRKGHHTSFLFWVFEDLNMNIIEADFKCMVSKQNLQYSLRENIIITTTIIMACCPLLSEAILVCSLT